MRQFRRKFTFRIYIWTVECITRKHQWGWFDHCRLINYHCASRLYRVLFYTKPECSAKQLLAADLSYCWLYPSKQAVDCFMLFAHLYYVLFSHLEHSVEQVLTANISARTAGAGRLLIAMSMNNLKSLTNARIQPVYKLNHVLHVAALFCWLCVVWLPWSADLVDIPSMRNNHWVVPLICMAVVVQVTLFTLVCRLLIERCLLTCIVPVTLPEKEKVERLLSVYAGLDDHASKSVNMIILQCMYLWSYCMIACTCMHCTVHTWCMCMYWYICCTESDFYFA